MKVVHGDLLVFALRGDFDVIVHGCNCQCVMGAGIAGTIRRKFPEAYAADRVTARANRDKLGTISWATVIKEGHLLTIVNGYTQFHWRSTKPGPLVEYDAVRSVMAVVKSQFSGKRIGYPKIGAGLAQGDWQLISQIIDEELNGEDHTLVEFPPGWFSNSP